MAKDPSTWSMKDKPEKFDIDDGAHAWRRWKNRWEAYKETSGLADLLEDNDVRKEKKAKKMVGALQWAWTDSTADAVASLSLTDDERKNAQMVIDALNILIEGGTSDIVYMQELLTRTRRDDETMQSYILALRDLAKKAEVPAGSDFLMVALLAKGVNEDKIAFELMQMTKPREFNAAATKAVQMYQSLQNVGKVNSGGEAMTNRFQNHEKEPGGTKEKKGPPCGQCGFSSHHYGTCPAADKECLKCGLKGHFSKVCKTSKTKSKNNRRHGKGNMAKAQRAEHD
jgi:hypothetical protein